MDEIIKHNIKIDPESLEKAVKIYHENSRSRKILIGITILSFGIIFVAFSSINNNIRSVFFGVMVIVYSFFYIFRSLSNSPIYTQDYDDESNFYRINEKGF